MVCHLPILLSESSIAVLGSFYIIHGLASVLRGAFFMPGMRLLNIFGLPLAMSDNVV